MPHNKSKGSKTERELVKIFTEHGWRAVRVAGSGILEESPCDLITGKLGRKGFTVEVKSSKKNSIYISKSQINDFVLFSNIMGLKPVIAARFNHKGWFFLEPKFLKDSGKLLVLSIETAENQGKRFSQFFEG
ncbi:hypothetical protein HYV50_05465 [Candidatus Pacearchaeota archaeon]|nr:hypothetical protein [Candidatus Pacearchaeota archaeon]